jgi:hypothetical protein
MSHDCKPVQIQDFEDAHEGTRVLLTTSLPPATPCDQTESVYTHRLLAFTGPRFLHPLSPCVVTTGATSVSPPPAAARVPQHASSPRSTCDRSAAGEAAAHSDSGGARSANGGSAAGGTGSGHGGAALLFRVIGGAAPDALSARQAAALAEAACYYLADPVVTLLPGYLAPMFDTSGGCGLSGREARCSTFA